MLKGFLKKIDKFCLKWLGLRYAIRPDQVKMINNEIIILSTEENQRFAHTESLQQFISEFPYITQVDKEKLGVAVGKTLAKNLVVSFESVDIVRK